MLSSAPKKNIELSTGHLVIINSYKSHSQDVPNFLRLEDGKKYTFCHQYTKQDINARTGPSVAESILALGKYLKPWGKKKPDSPALREIRFEVDFALLSCSNYLTLKQEPSLKEKIADFRERFDLPDYTNKCEDFQLFEQMRKASFQFLEPILFPISLSQSTQPLKPGSESSSEPLTSGSETSSEPLTSGSEPSSEPLKPDSESSSEPSFFQVLASIFERYF